MRVAVGVGVALAAVGLVCFELGGPWTLGLVTVVLTVCAGEMFSTLPHADHRPQYRPARFPGLVAVAGLAIAPYFQRAFAYPVIFALLVIVLLAWYSFVDLKASLVSDLGMTLFVVAYVGGLGSFASLILGLGRAGQTGSLSNQGIGVILAAVMVTVCYDVGAFFTGKQFGRRPLSKLSPNKTLEGLAGGVGAGIVIPTLIVGVGGIHPVGTNLSTAFTFCLICALMAPVGDLCESAIKRSLGVKDLGVLIPGHGGVPDRFDAMLFVLPTAYFMARLLQLGAPKVF
ncbi:MAG: phosphatidate cytidylyltransferase [Microthrixaceae bacterium]